MLCRGLILRKHNPAVEGWPPIILTLRLDLTDWFGIVPSLSLRLIKRRFR